MNHTRFSPPHLLAEYKGLPGHEMNGLALSPLAMDALAEEITTGQRSLVVIGEWTRGDGAFFLDLGTPTGYVEATTNYRYDRDARRLRLICPDCEMKDGKHRRGCAA